MSKREIIIAVILFCVFGVWAKQKMSKGDFLGQVSAVNPLAKSALSPNSAGGNVSNNMDLKRVLAQVELQSKSAELDVVHDPFSPSGGSGGAGAVKSLEFSDLRLAGIFQEGGNYIALVNDEIVNVGDSILGYEVTDISENEVVGIKNMKTYTLHLYSDEEEAQNEQ